MCQDWIQKGLNKGFSDLAILINHHVFVKIGLENQKLENYVESKVISCFIKGIYKNQISEIYFENLNNDNVDYMLELLKTNISVITSKEPAIIFEGSEMYPNILENNFNFSNISLQAKIDLLKRLEKNLFKSSYFKKTEEIFYKEVFSSKQLINSKGLNLENSNRYAYVYGSAVFEKSNYIQSHEEIQLVKDFSDFNIDKQSDEIINLGQKKLDSVTLKSGPYQTVFSSEMFAILLENFSSIFSAENAYRNLTKLKDQLNEQIASPNVSIVDDPLSNLTYFKEKFDDEGVACYKKNIVQKGIFKSFINNLKMSRIFNQKPTGNFFDGNIMMTNCYLQPEHYSLEQIIASISDGVYITDLIGLHAGIQVVSGDFSLQANGFKIQNGKITTALKMMVISGNFFDILNNIKKIGNDFKFNLSGFGSASVYVGNLIFSSDN